MRIFSMCYFHWTVSEFEQVWNPSNCEIWVLEKVPRTGRYRLAGRWRQPHGQHHGGHFLDVRYGKSRHAYVPSHMKQPSDARIIVPGPNCLNAEALRGLSDPMDIGTALGIPFSV